MTGRPVRGAFVSGKTTPPGNNGCLFQALRQVPTGDRRDGNQPSIAAIRLAFPPAAVVSMQVTRSVAKRAT